MVVPAVFTLETLAWDPSANAGEARLKAMNERRAAARVADANLGCCIEAENLDIFRMVSSES